MFKIMRDGKEVKSPKSDNINIAQATLEICKEGKYTNHNHEVIDIDVQLKNTIDNTVLYDNSKVFSKPLTAMSILSMPSISVTKEKAGTAARRMLAEGKTNIVALNFASGTCPGGGFLGGASAQEEDLCRASGLYPSIKSKPKFYNDNIGNDNSHYNDSMIYSPNVVFFKDDDTFQPLDKPFSLSIITSPAPNLRSPSTDQHLTDPKLPEIFRKRAIRIFEVARAHGHKNLILGAWGCGAFGNDPKMVSDAFKEAMLVVPGFENICFAVYDTGDCKNFNHFTDAFK